MSTRCACSTASKLSSSLATVARPSLTFTRTFASSRRDTIPPESPRYVHVPEPKQGQRAEIVPPRIPGSLPSPKPIFTGPKDPKLRDDYMDRFGPSSQAALYPVPEGSPRDIKRRMAEARRRNYLEGLSGLLDRKIEHDTFLEEKAEKHIKKTTRMRNAPERLDDVLTRSTVLHATRTQVAVKPDPKRFAQARKSQARTAKLQENKSEKRRAALMALYATAADFIVNEEQLSEKVESIFQEDFFKKQAHSQSPDAENAWDVWGAPSTLGYLASAGGRAGNASDFDHTEADRTVRRQRSIAEDLTGGKLGSTKTD
ncbi:hypothetical protein F5X68DRAFT_218248 [Plectosphaerella plurivora]|uniref:Uncharacterized protein n=1 Tax=Plectosphaerella plurivora TaxID=936078 RepID=A0A9P9A6K3_9PEZI|nr:hypothetical protein F5X68DRAFT_218248 [Plectosphaerella plurivora]